MQLLLFLTGNAADGGFKRVIARAGIDRFMQAALKLEVQTGGRSPSQSCVVGACVCLRVPACFSFASSFS